MSFFIPEGSYIYWTKIRTYTFDPVGVLLLYQNNIYKNLNTTESKHIIKQLLLCPFVLRLIKLTHPKVPNCSPCFAKTL